MLILFSFWFGLLAENLKCFAERKRAEYGFVFWLAIFHHLGCYAVPERKRAGCGVAVLCCYSVSCCELADCFVCCALHGLNMNYPSHVVNN